ncbi:hypothetical protein [Haloglomus litoreum]|uniref:hypothetical protein n=1 Tax=Haloglomus litoreum TaxID=3034026 RepID=UPI0023E8A3FA|nr:hypothetical protein [Haloglomus sp. DT116]
MRKLLIQDQPILAKISATIISLFTVYLSLRSREVASGFGFERLAILTQNIAGDQSVIHGFPTLPGQATLFASLNSILGVPILDIYYLPIVQMIGISSLVYIFYTLSGRDIGMTIAGTIAVFFYAFAPVPHFRIYSIGVSIYLFFAATVWTANIYRQKRYLFLNFLLYISLAIMSPPMQMWALALAFAIVVPSYIIRCVNFFNGKNQPNNLGRIVNKFTPYPFLLLLIFLFHNPKLYEQFLTVVIFDINLEPLITGSETSQTSRFVVNSLSSSLVYYFRIIWVLSVTVAALAILLYLLHKSSSDNERLCTKATFLFPLAGIFTVDFVVYGLLGYGFAVRYIVYVFPAIILAGYALGIRRAVRGLVLVLVLLSMSIFTAQQIQDPQHKLPDQRQTVEASGWTTAATSDGSTVTTDHYTYGVLKYTLAEETGSSRRIGYGYQEPTQLREIKYTKEIYASLIGKPVTQDLPDYILVNNNYNNVPISQGPPGWRFFEPYDKHQSGIASNTKTDKIYSSNGFTIYSFE